MLALASGDKVLARAALFMIACDIPACRKVCGFAGPGATNVTTLGQQDLMSQHNVIIPTLTHPLGFQEGVDTKALGTRMA